MWKSRLLARPAGHGKNAELTVLSEFRPVMLVTGALVSTLGVAMLLPALVDLAADNDDWMIFASSAMVTMLFGFGLFIANRGAPKGLSTRQAMLMTVVSWLALVAFGALPFHWSGIVPSYTDAFFESMSGLTTTGATVITGLDTAPPGMLFWRGLLQWLGGLGIIVMAIAVLPMLQIGGMQLFKAEAFDTAEKILPRATQISTSITLVFIASPASAPSPTWPSGMAADDAVIHAMTTVATGGFSTKDALDRAYFANPGVEWVAVLFMMLGRSRSFSMCRCCRDGFVRSSWISRSRRSLPFSERRFWLAG
jgi:trk system potassium uptake protein TrkH